MDSATEIHLRHLLHSCPELSEQEERTAEVIGEALKPLEPSILLENLGTMGTGICAVFEGEEPGPTVLLRCELDALPIDEAPDSFPYASQNKGVSHKCGHDGHMATLIALAKLISDCPPPNGRVALVFQPAEETGTGAVAVLEDKRFKDAVKPDWVFGFHNVPGYPLGQVLVREGCFAAASEGFRIRLDGKKVHSSYPEDGQSPALLLSRLISEVEAMNQLTLSQEPKWAVVTTASLGETGAGPCHGIAPGEAELNGTLRAYSDSDLHSLKRRLTERVEALTSDTPGISSTLSWHEPFSVTTNDSTATKLIENAARKAELPLQTLEEPFRWSEDFGSFTKSFRGAFFGLGSGTDHPQLHQNDYDYPDDLIAHGVRMYQKLIHEILKGNDHG